MPRATARPRPRAATNNSWVIVLYSVIAHAIGRRSERVCEPLDRRRLALRVDCRCPLAEGHYAWDGSRKIGLPTNEEIDSRRSRRTLRDSHFDRSNCVSAGWRCGPGDTRRSCAQETRRVGGRRRPAVGLTSRNDWQKTSRMSCRSTAAGKKRRTYCRVSNVGPTAVRISSPLPI